jgi:hypothetical protein
MGGMLALSSGIFVVRIGQTMKFNLNLVAFIVQPFKSVLQLSDPLPLDGWFSIIEVFGSL